ncbi:MAG: DUF3953 domain-containing protein [Prevotella sp.]|nr:DUF3953 domain-containing protein [Prevotella sp.]
MTTCQCDIQIAQSPEQNKPGGFFVIYVFTFIFYISFFFLYFLLYIFMLIFAMKSN